MGTLKQLLPFGDRTVLERVVDALLASRATPVVVVLGHRAEDVRAALGSRPVIVTLNPDPAGDMLSSVRCGLRATPPDRPVLIALGDQPLITPGLIEQVIDAFEQGRGGIVIPTYQGQRGHPMIMAARYREDIFALQGAGGLKQLRDRHPDEVSEVPVETDAVLIDLDDPQAYQAALKRLSTGG